MPRMVLEHEPWCQVHDDGIGQELCASNSYDFGPAQETDDSLCQGFVYASRAESDDQTRVIFHFPIKGRIDVTSLSPGLIRQIAAAIEHDPQQLLNALRELIRDLDQEAPLAKENS